MENRLKSSLVLADPPLSWSSTVYAPGIVMTISTLPVSKSGIPETPWTHAEFSAGPRFDRYSGVDTLQKSRLLPYAIQDSKILA